MADGSLHNDAVTTMIRTQYGRDFLTPPGSTLDSESVGCVTVCSTV